MTETGKGIAAMTFACVIWGLSPLYYKLLTVVPPFELLAHRTLWSLLTFALILAMRRRMLNVFDALGRAPWRIALAAVMISFNWFGFIFSIQTGRAAEASLGYYLFPLVAVSLGVLFFRDRLRPLQWIAVSLAGLAVGLLTLSLGLVPIIPLGLAMSFGLYGVLKKGFDCDPIVSVTAEVLILAPIALAYLWSVHHLGWPGLGSRAGGYLGQDMMLSFLLVLSGFITALPLILFSYASRRLTLPTVGLIQYVNPTLQFLCAVVVFGEVLTGWHILVFALIWVGLALYSFDGLRASRKSATAEDAVSAV